MESDSAGEDQDHSVHFDLKLMALAKYQALPEPVKRRVRALKKLQHSYLLTQAEFYDEMHDLERRYQEKQAPQVDRRREIVSGGAEPTDEDADWPEPLESEAGLAALLRDKMQMVAELPKGDVKEQQEQQEQKEEKEEEEKKEAESVRGVPGFWLTAMKNVELLSQMIQKHDEPLLERLADIGVRLFAAGSSGSELPGFELVFRFEENEYFTNETLTKRYYLRHRPDPKRPWDFEGPEIVRCEGCDILWRRGKNVTVKTVKKVQKHRSGGQRRTITKTIETDSFFNFFNPPTQSIDEVDDDDEGDTDSLLQADFEIGQFLRENFAPRAVLYFTGDALDDEEEEDEGDDEELDDEDDDEDGEENSGDSEDGAARGRAGGRRQQQQQQQQQECKQQ